LDLGRPPAVDELPLDGVDLVFVDGGFFLFDAAGGGWLPGTELEWRLWLLVEVGDASLKNDREGNGRDDEVVGWSGGQMPLEGSSARLAALGM
jgi:hypothetical protein